MINTSFINWRSNPVHLDSDIGQSTVRRKYKTNKKLQKNQVRWRIDRFLNRFWFLGSEPTQNDAKATDHLPYKAGKDALVDGSFPSVSPSPPLDLSFAMVLLWGKLGWVVGEEEKQHDKMETTVLTQKKNIATLNDNVMTIIMLILFVKYGITMSFSN